MHLWCAIDFIIRIYQGNAWQEGKKMPPLLITGPTGTGKTMLAHAVASEFGWDLFEFNASDFRDEESVSGILSHSASSGSLFGTRRLILIDDADSLSGSADRGGAGAQATAALAFMVLSGGW
jgi:replication factor C large subunit